MPVKTIKYSRLFNIGNFEHERFEVEIELDEGQDCEEAFQGARKIVELEKKQSDENREAAIRRRQEEWDRQYKERNKPSDKPSDMSNEEYIKAVNSGDAEIPF